MSTITWSAITRNKTDGELVSVVLDETSTEMETILQARLEKALDRIEELETRLRKYGID